MSVLPLLYIYIETIYRSPVGRPVITFYALCLEGNFSTGLPLQIWSDWNLIFEVRNTRATKWTVQCCISQHVEQFNVSLHFDCRSQWPRDLRRRSTAARLPRLWVRIPPVLWMFVCCECCVLSGRGLCEGLITRPEESYRLWRVVVYDKEISKTRRLTPATGLWKYKHNEL